MYYFSNDDKAIHIFHIQMQTAILFPHPASVGPLKRKVKKAEGFLEKRRKFVRLQWRTWERG